MNLVRIKNSKLLIIYHLDSQFCDFVNPLYQKFNFLKIAQHKIVTQLTQDAIYSTRKLTAIE